MTPEDRRRLRAALKIHDRLARSEAAPPLVPPLDAWRRLLRAARRATLAEERGWPRAAVAARADHDRAAAELVTHLSAGPHASDRGGRAHVQSAREILADLAALEAEFGESEIDLKECTVSVTTDPIVLEGVELGPFEIALRWDLDPDSGAYSLIALNPNPAEADPSVTHPHVQHEALCEGEGRVPIRRALEQGRLYDFFVLVRSVLVTYNADSAHVPLSAWSGRPCADCGEIPPQDEEACCDRCGDDLCTRCMAACVGCDDLCCAGCRERCGGCDEPCCRACRTACRECGDARCPICLDGGRCGDCREPDDDHDSQKDSDAIPTLVPRTEPPNASPPVAHAPAATSDPAVHALRLGEAAVPA